jgi:RHS repeat-associated protein
MNNRKLYTLLLSILLLATANGFAQNIVINGKSLVYAGQTVTYTAFFQQPPGSHARIEWKVDTGAVILQQNTDPASGSITLTLRWDAPQIKRYALVSITETQTAQKGSLEVQGYNPANTDCRIFPEQLFCNAGQSPGLISGVDYCAIDRATGQPYPHTYQWQKSDDQQLVWEDIRGADQPDYQPPDFDAPTKSYRRKTIYIIEDVETISISNTCLVSARALEAGEIFNRDIVKPRDLLMVNYGTIPDIDTWSGSGGICAYYQYQYVWERSDNNGPWYEIGTGKFYPANAPPVNRRNVRIRRKINCDGEIAYTNILAYGFFFDYPNKENLNYVRVNDIKVRGISFWEEADLLPTGEKTQGTTYFDGLMRPIQTVIKDFATNGENKKDLVSLNDYDNLGRATKQYLPYTTGDNPGKFKTQSLIQQSQYYQQRYGDTLAYHKSGLDNSPLNRVLKGYSPGAKWVGDNKSTNADIQFNTEADNLQNWWVAATVNAIPQSLGMMGNGECIRIESTDEKGRKAIRYINRDGQTVLEKIQLAETPAAAYTGWICTYYVYDELNRLRCVIQPEAVRTMAQTANWTVTPTILAEQCFRYEYDKRGRMITQKAPGKGIEQMVYDERDRLVFTQTANQQSGRYNNNQPQWTFRLFDETDRPVAEGVVNLNRSRTDLQTDVDGLLNGNKTVTLTTSVTENLRVFNPVAGAAAWCAACTATEYYSIHYYDGYGYAGAKTFTNQYFFDNIPTAINTIEPTANTLRQYGYPTGGKVKILNGGNQWLTHTVYYDEAGRALQSIADNIRGGEDVKTAQFDFSGNNRGTSAYHTNPGTPFTAFPVHRKTETDLMGRNTALWEAAGFGGIYKKLAGFEYDDMGRLLQKEIGSFMPTGAMAPMPLETLTYSYNLQGWLTGINKEYALNTGNDQWAHYFGLYLEYENKSGLFNTSRLDGKLTGQQWRSQGDGVQRRFNYEYDNADRLTAARFSENDPLKAAGWTNTKTDFSAVMGYDHNGNLLTMQQYGVVPGKTPLLIDNLAYQYKTGSNQLQNISDNQNGLGNLNGRLGDFADKSNETDEYGFDEDGNTTNDRNKGIQAGGIRYNAFNLPVKITLQNKGEIELVYDGAGNKVQKIVRETGQPVKTISYIGGFIYERTDAGADLLQYILNPTGKLRVISPVGNAATANFTGGGIGLPGNKQGVYDYFITDQLGNVRMVLTEEQHKSGDNCSMEMTDAAYDESLFGSSSNNEVLNSRVSTPAAWKAILPPAGDPANRIKEKVSRLSATGQKTGPNSLLRVMAGDILHTKADYFYEGSQFNTPAGNAVSTLLGSFLSALTDNRGGSLAKSLASDIGNQVGSNIPLSDLLSPQSGSGVSGTPRAYLNYIFFDEQFNYISQGSGSIRVKADGNGVVPLVVTNIQAPRNGYAYIYLSNESAEPVYFDNFAVTHERGRLIEENHYYAFGLKIAGISSRAAEKPATRYGYQGRYSEALEELEAGYNEFSLRTYDPQIGRWLQVDPVDQVASPYNGMDNDPVNNSDPSGGIVAGVSSGFIGHSLRLFGNAVGNAVNSITKSSLILIDGGLIYNTSDKTLNKMSDDTDWKDLDKNTLKQLTDVYFCPFPIKPPLITCDWTNAQLENATGFVLENTWNKFMSAGPSYIPNEIRLNIGGVVPEGFSSALVGSIGTKSRMQVQLFNAWYEAKASGRNSIPLSYAQIKKEIDVMANIYKKRIAKGEIIYYNLITPSNVLLPQTRRSLIEYVKSKGIQFAHIVPKYRSEGNKILVKFEVKENTFGTSIIGLYPEVELQAPNKIYKFLK